MADLIKTVQAFTLTLPRDTPYPGTPRPGEEPNARGYLVPRGLSCFRPLGSGAR
jgi:galactonate dehydratase